MEMINLQCLAMAHNPLRLAPRKVVVMKKKVSKIPLTKETLHALDYPLVTGGFTVQGGTCGTCLCTVSGCQSCRGSC
jgi:hypothetical protein